MPYRVFLTFIFILNLKNDGVKYCDFHLQELPQATGPNYHIDFKLDALMPKVRILLNISDFAIF